MKAILIVIVSWIEFGTSLYVPMPTMDGCRDAANKIERQYQADREFAKHRKTITVVCVENR